MKKLLLLLVAGSFVTGAFAQSANVSMVRINATSQVRSEGVPASVTSNSFAAMRAGNKANKTTGVTGGDRWYNYADYIDLINSSIANNASFPYIWNHDDVLGIYSNGSGGTEADTIRLSSYGMTFDPTFPPFNDGTAYPGMIGITKSNAYTVDSVRIYGIYGRNPSINTTVDTLRVSFVYGGGDGAAAGSNLPYYYYRGMQADYNSDTVGFDAILYDSVKNTAASTGSNPSVITRDIYLHNTDTSINNLAVFSTVIDGGVHVPAGKILAVTVSFKSGEVVPALDTIFLGSVNSALPYKHGLFRPEIFEENSGGFPTYTPHYFNTGYVKFLPDTGGAGGYKGIYIPSYAFTAPFQLEIPNIDVHVSCATCFQTAVTNVTNIISKTVAYPNPANEEVTVPFTINHNADVTVTLYNTLGQVVNMQNMGNLTSGKAVFNVSKLSGGIYFYTIQANEQRTTGRVVVAH